MSQRKQHYTVAKHTFSITMPDDNAIWRVMQGYKPFIDNVQSATTCFDLSIVPEIECQNTSPVWIDSERAADVVDMEIHANDSHYLFIFKAAFSNDINGRLCCSRDFKTAQMTINGTLGEQSSIFYMATMLLYSLSTYASSTVLMHASAAVYDGKAYLFHAKSGTGKSTHNRLWQQYIPGAEVLNDDHPILRIEDDGSIIAYGSPWSGKTPCYRNAEYPLAAMVRINQAPQNAIKKLSLVESYASFTSSSATMKWERQMMDEMHKTIEHIITTVPCYRLDCLPDEAAARLCWSTVTHQETK
jgi:hypothetical protein